MLVKCLIDKKIRQTNHKSVKTMNLDVWFFSKNIYNEK